MAGLTIKDRIILEYPLPIEASIWKNFSLDDLLVSCLDDCESDLELYDAVSITYSPYEMPEGTRQITSVKVDSLMQTQANQFVKYSFDRFTRKIACRFVPALVSYKRNVTLHDLNTITGSVLQYFKAYTIVKMLEKEISYLTAVKLESTTGSIDVKGLEAVKVSLEAKLDRFRLDISFPSNG